MNQGTKNVSARSLPFKSLYSGMISSLILTVPAQSSYLMSYHIVKGEDEVNESPFIHAKAAFAAEMISSAFWTPMDVIKNHAQFYNRNTRETIRAIYKVNGLRSFYHGYGLSLVVYLPFSATFFISYEKLKSLMHNHRNSSLLPIYDYAGCAAVAAALAVAVTNPVDMIKTRKQIGLVSAETAGDGIIKILRREGWNSLRRGMGMRLAFYVPSTCLSFTVFEGMYHYFDQESYESAGIVRHQEDRSNKNCS